MIIGISGLAGSGKDTAADFLVKNHGFVRVGLADPLKRICKEVFDFTDEQLWGPSSERNADDTRYVRTRRVRCDEYHAHSLSCTEPVYLTSRHALQQLGTEWGRGCYKDVWIDYGIRVAKALLSLEEPLQHYNMLRGLTLCTGSRPCNLQAKGVVFSDIRFKNEMAAILRAGGVLWRMKRGEGLGGAAGLHPSEAEQMEVLDDSFALVIDNNDITLAQLSDTIDTWISH